MSENRLIAEKSPYLLQHAHNPVDWYPWGDEAFRRAKEEDKPVFLSIGYSTCHWCHVMERESFEDQEVAELLNRHFVAVKVDREERPDVDAVYMAVCQALTGSGGWPLTILMTPEQKPFWAGTYLPKRSRWGQLGLTELLKEAARLWLEDRRQVLAAGKRITAEAFEKRERSLHARPERALCSEAAALFRRMFDPAEGGFGPAPKFPTPHNLLFLMEYAQLEGDSVAMEMAEKTLTQMARGGIFDQIGGGFSRYSTDNRWLAPHFEKMLYDNALLAVAYLEAFRLTGRPLYRRTAKRTLDYLLRELRDPMGGFYCGQDADSDGEEGKYYLFEPGEVAKVLGKEAGAVFCQWFDIAVPGNFEDKSIPNLLKNAAFEQFPPELSDSCRQLYDYRLTRTKLHRDDKVLTAWNGLAIAALARAGRVLGEDRYLEAARMAASFVESCLTGPDGRLYLRWREGEGAIMGQLDDYAFFAWGLLELYDATFEVRFLAKAAALAGQMADHFWDQEMGGFYRTPDDGEALIHRPKEFYDGAIPSGNSAAALVLTRLWAFTGEVRWRVLADRQLCCLAGEAAHYPAGYSFSMLALCEALYPQAEMVCALSGKIPAELGPLCQRHRLRTLVKTAANAGMLAQTAPFTEQYPLPEKGEHYYLCRDGACSEPLDSLEALMQRLGED